MPLDLPHAHAPPIHPDHLLIEAGKSSLIIGNELRVERASAVARNVERKPAALGQHCLLAVADPVVVSSTGIVAAQMLVRLRA